MENKIKKKNLEMWNQADEEFNWFKMNDSSPAFLGEKLDTKDKIAPLNRIIEKYGDYFPAIIDRGIQKIQSKMIKDGCKDIVQGIKLLFAIGNKVEQNHFLDSLLGVLGQLYLYETHIEVLKIAIENNPKDKDLYNELSKVSIEKGDFESFKINLEKAIKLAPNDKSLKLNYGYGFLLNGDLDKAEKCFNKNWEAKELNDIANYNLGIVKWLRANPDKNYSQYFAQPLTEEQFEEMAIAGVLHNLAIRKKYDDIANIKTNIMAFFNFCSQIGECFYIKDFDFFNDNMKTIMHKFIFKHGDVNEEMIDNVFSGIIAFYDAYSRLDKSIKKEVVGFKKMCKPLLKEMIIKTKKYNKVRHSGMDEGKLEDIRTELFDDDYEFFFI